MFKIALAWPVSERELVRLRTYVTEACEIVSPKSDAVVDLVEVARDADAIVGTYVPQAMIDSSKRVKMVQVLHSGVAHSTSLDGRDMGFSFDTLRARNIILGNIAGANAIGVAEHAITLMLVLAKKLLPAHHAISEELPYPFDLKSMGLELAGKTIGILGMGAIGVEVAKRARAFGMRIIGTKRTPTPELVGELGLAFLSAPGGLHRVLRDSDFVVISMPWMPSTDKMIGREELKSMKETAYLVNVARARLIDEESLYQALVGGWIAGFATDVWWNPEMMRNPSAQIPLRLSFGSDDPPGNWTPLPQQTDAPLGTTRTGLHKLDNVVLTADRAVWSPDTLQNFPRVALQNVDMFARGVRPKHLVDLSIQA